MFVFVVATGDNTGSRVKGLASVRAENIAENCSENLGATHSNINLRQPCVNSKHSNTKGVNSKP